MTDLARMCARWSACVGPRDHQGSCLDENGHAMPVPMHERIERVLERSESNTPRTSTRLLTAVSYRPATRALSVAYDDGEIVEVVVDALKLPDGAKIENVRLDEFRRGVEFWLADGTMHDVAADYITWLTDAAYREQYPDDRPDEDIAALIGKNVVALRNQRGMSQAALAHSTGILGPNLSRLESGKHVPTLTMLLRLARALGVSLGKLVGPTYWGTRPTRAAVAAAKVSQCVCELRDRMWNGYGKCLRCGRAYVGLRRKDPRET